MKRVLSLLLAVVMICTMLPNIFLEANAHSVVMTADEFIGYLQHVVNRGDSKYGSGDQYSIGKYDGKNIYFDCWGLGESIICTNGKIVYNKNSSLNPWNLWDKSSGCGSYSGDHLKTLCQLSNDFSNIAPGEWLFKDDSSGHCYHVGYYIGNGKVIESTSDGTYKTQITTIDSSGHSNIRVSSWKWTSHAKVPWIEYVDPLIKETFPSYGIIEITSKSTYVKSLPCSKETDPNSVDVEDKHASMGDTYTAIGLYKNTSNNLWYKVKAKNGKEGYIFAGDALKFTQLVDDVSVANISAPTEIAKGNVFYLKGTISTQYQIFTEIGAVVRQGSVDKTGDYFPVNTKQYVLDGSAVDKAVSFGTLGVGSYDYVITADVESYYAISGTEYKTSVRYYIPYWCSFNVVDGIPSGGSGGSTPATYTITFMANGGTCSTSTLAVTAGKGIGTLPDASFGDMGFEGWYTEAYGGTQVTASTVPTGNMTVWAHYSNPLYPQRLNFDPNGGTIPGPVLTDTIDGVNRDRPSEALVAFNESGATVNTNTYGVEIAVDNKGEIVGVRNSYDENKLTVPNGGFVLSGQTAWNETTQSHVGGCLFVWDILELEKAYVHLNYETGVVKVFDSYAGYLAETKRGQEYTTLGVLPVPFRDGYVFRGWRDQYGYLVDYYSGFAGTNYYAQWEKETELVPVATLEYNGHYYELYDHNVSWTTAKALCESMGGYLVSITDSAEQAKIAALITEGNRGMYRIGATDAASEGSWEWVSGETFSYINWDKDASEPGGGDIENYGNIIAIENPPHKQVGEWLDDHDASYGTFYDISNTGFVCEYNKLPGCSHNYQSIVTKATCTNGGYTTHTCTLCGDSYVDSPVTALGHSWNAATCTTAKKCKTCGATEGTALGHSWNAATCTAAKKCKTCGATEGNALGHSWNDATCTTAKKCKACGATEGTALGHSWNDATCTTAKKCKTCGATEGTALGHSWNAATCTAAKKCKACGATEGTALGHTEVIDKAVDATCTATGLTEGKHCSVCGAVTVAQQTVAATGHTNVIVEDVPPTCTEYGMYGRKTCTVCNEVLGALYPISPTGHVYTDDSDTICYVCGYEREAEHAHNYTAEVTAPTCTEEGYTTFICTCGDSYKDNFVSATGHSWNEATCTTPETCKTCGINIGNVLGHTEVIDKAVAATCTTVGKTEGKHCSSCGEVLVAQQEIPLAEHTYADDQDATCDVCGHERDIIPEHTHSFQFVKTTATCTGYGETTNVCTICGYELTNISVPLGHHYTSEVTKEPTPTEVGVRTHTCERCGDSYTEDVLSVFGTVTMGTCGENVLWSFDSATGKLRIWGEGEMRFKSVGGHRVWTTVIPWKEFGNQITEIAIEEGVTNIASEAFIHCSLVTNLTIPSSITYIGEAFNGSFENITFTGDAPDFNTYAFEYRTIVAYYPAGNETWTEDVLQNYGGTVTWIAQQNNCEHIEVIDMAVAATCTDAGKTEGKHCSVCNTVIVAQQTVAAKGHTYTDDQDATCDTCGYVREIAAPEHQHSYQAVVTAPSCTEQGYTTFTCACGDSYKDNFVSATDHSWADATCNAPMTCHTCGITVGTVLDHIWTKATCSQPKTCTACGATSGYALGHDWAGGNCTTPKTCTVCGLKDGGAVHAYDSQYDYKCNACGQTRTVDMTRPMVDMFRMYDPNSGEHFYTGSDVERDNLIAAGWNYEGVGFTFPLTTGDPVHRLYDPVYGEHLYTMDVEEMNMLLAQGWNYEGIAFNSGFENEVPQYRLHNPNATRGAYHFTASLEERDMLISLGWEYQGIGWYSLGG